MFSSVTAFGPCSLLDAPQAEGSATQGAFKDTHWEPGVGYPWPVMWSFICKADSLATYCMCVLLLAYCIVLKMGTCGSAWMAHARVWAGEVSGCAVGWVCGWYSRECENRSAQGKQRSTKSQRRVCRLVEDGQRKRPEWFSQEASRANMGMTDPDSSWWASGARPSVNRWWIGGWGGGEELSDLLKDF